MKTSAKHISKAAMVAQKDQAILIAAHKHFLQDGFAEASMDVIANAAGVSVKTIYGHFANKAELFCKVMIAACTDHSPSSGPSSKVIAVQFPWFAKATQRGLMEAGADYLTHLLSEEQLALYRVLTRDASRFPELGRQYHTNFAQGRTGILIAYFTNLAEKNSWVNRDASQDAALFEALLRAGIYEEVLHGVSIANAQGIKQHARAAARTMWKVLTVITDKK